jgi:hypothetical protein
MFEPEQFRSLVKDTLCTLAEDSGIPGLYSDEAVELLMLTAAQESHLGRYLVQLKGPAKGVFQIEPNTHDDLFKNYLTYKPSLKAAVQQFASSKLPHENLRSNLAYQVVIARLIYFRKSEPMPKTGKVEDLARYWKVHYNTMLGKGTIQEAMNNYKRYVVEGGDK